ncbi:hypothetical protein [Streptacidiphilus sp. EB103A]|uniref:hypothetical protein n=1 Tax=Streptacidiphilus sp. EB103A TaxID=3156275 RepID=UPI003514F670
MEQPYSSTARPQPTTEPQAPPPRALVGLERKCRAAGWTVEVRATDGEAQLTVSGRVRDPETSSAAQVKATWRLSSGSLRWAGGQLLRNGVLVRSNLSWTTTTELIDRGTASLLDPAAELQGVTRHGRTRAEWEQAVQQHALTARSAFEHGVQVHGAMEAAAETICGVAWARVAEAATGAVHHRLGRRAAAVQAIVRTARREQADDSGAPRAFDLAMRARALAGACERDAEHLDECVLAAEAEAHLAPYLEQVLAEQSAREAAWREEHPDGDAEQFASQVLGAFRYPAQDFALWWDTHDGPTSTFTEGWDLMHKQDPPHGETTASLRIGDQTHREIINLGILAAGHLRTAGGADQAPRAQELMAQASSGAALFEPGARRGMHSAADAASRVWALLAGRSVRTGGRHLRAADDLDELAPWLEVEATSASAAGVRRLLLMSHALSVRSRARYEQP